MSLADSVFLAVQSLISCGFGLSLGIEGGFTQAAGAVGSKAGQLLNRRRHDVRSAGRCRRGRWQSAGAFGAPFAGAAYGFRAHPVGSYTVANLAPVVAASVSGTLSARALDRPHIRAHTLFDAFDVRPGMAHAVSAIVLGILCGTVIGRAHARRDERRRVCSDRSGLRTTWLSGCRRNSGWPHSQFSFRASSAPRSPSHGCSVSHGAFATWLCRLPFAPRKPLRRPCRLALSFRGGLFCHIALFLGAVTGALAGRVGVSFGFLYSRRRCR